MDSTLVAYVAEAVESVRPGAYDYDRAADMAANLLSISADVRHCAEAYGREDPSPERAWALLIGAVEAYLR